MMGTNDAPQGVLRSLRDVPAPAKINWFLHVLGRRDDGYHLLQTVFQFIDWCDWLDFELRDDGQIRRSGGDDLPEDDLCVRAARLLQRASGCGLGVDIRLRKSIPAQAGLGGGSSDAATTLLALNRLWGLRWPRQRLLELALQLGADVPVFVFGRNAFAEGVGERLQPLSLPSWDLLVAWPGVGLSTAAVFGSPLLRRDTPARSVADVEQHLRRAQDRAELGLDFGRNDLQPVARQALPQLEALQQWLACYGSPVLMSGSGSALFVPCQDAQPQGADPSWVWRRCRALAQHPLLDWAD